MPITCPDVLVRGKCLSCFSKDQATICVFLSATGNGRELGFIQIDEGAGTQGVGSTKAKFDTCFIEFRRSCMKENPETVARNVVPEICCFIKDQNGLVA